MQYEWNIERERTWLLSEMRQRIGRLYSQMLLPFWRPMAGYIAIGLHAAAEPLVDFLVLHESLDVITAHKQMFI